MPNMADSGPMHKGARQMKPEKQPEVPPVSGPKPAARDKLREIRTALGLHPHADAYMRATLSLELRPFAARSSAMSCRPSGSRVAAPRKERGKPARRKRARRATFLIRSCAGRV